MLRGYIVYILMFVVLGLGLWAVLSIGSTLRAPTEIAGQWNVHWETRSPSGGGFKGTMAIEQSGRFCTFHFDGTRAMSLKIVEGSALGHGGPELPLARLTGEGYDVTLHSAAGDAVRLEIAGRGNHRGMAERISRPSARAAAPAAAQPPVLPPVADAQP